MDFLPEAIHNYCEDHTTAENDILTSLNRETHLKIMVPRMLSGHLQGRVLSMLSHMISPKYILEIGTYTGYSALCMAEGLQADGRLDSIDRNEELKPIIEKHWQEAPQASQMHWHVGNALDIIPTLPHPYDLVFIDADKENYSNYYDQVIDQVRPGGYIIADNVLWSGHVIETGEKQSKSTKAIIDFNQKVHDDPRVENVLFPIRDGLMVLRKRP